jgi:hypothetical protein
MHITLLSFRMVTLFFSLPEYVYVCCYCCTWTTRLSYVIVGGMLLLQRLFFMCVYMWLRERGWWWCSGKREKPLSFFSSSFSLSFDRIWLMRYLTTTSYLSLLFLLSVGFYLLAKKHIQRIVIRRRQRERDKIIAYTIGTSEAAILHQNKTSVGREEEEGGTGGEIIFYFYYYHHIKNNTRWMNKR